MIEVGTPLSFDVSGPLAGLQKIADADNELRQQQLKTNQAIGTSFASVATSVGQYGAQLSSVIVETQRGAAAQQQFAREISGLVKEIRDQAAATREQQRALAESAAERRKASAAAREAARAEKAAAKEVAAAEKEVAAAARLAAKEVASAAKEAEKSGGVLNKVFGGVQAQVGAAFSLAAAKAFFDAVKENALASEAILSKLGFANGGNVQAATRDLSFLRFEADKLGLGLNGAGKSYGSFVAAAAAGNFPLSESRKLFLATAGASSALKLSQEDTNGVLLALTQILSKGTLSAEELRQQIGERLPGAFSVAARAMGVTEQQLNKLLQTGQIKSADFLPKFAAELQKTFGDGSAEAVDALTANLNRGSNEVEAFFLRFEGLAVRGAKSFADFARRFNEGLDLKSNDGRARLGEKAAQPGIQAYEGLLGDLVKQAEAQAKQNGTDVAFAVGALLAQQRNTLDAQMAQAKQALSFFDTSTKQGNINAGNFPGGLQAFRQAEVQARARISLLDGEIAKLDEVRAAREKADDPKDLEGLILKQEALIKALKVRQRAQETTERKQPGGADFLLGAGGLDEQLKAAEKELDRLLGKVDKAAKAAADKLAAALAALAAAREQLQVKAAAAATKDADDQALRAKLAFEESIRQVGVVEEKLKAAEARVRRAGGRGANADSVIDGPEDRRLATLRIAALDQYYGELYKIEVAREQRLFDLRADSNAKEIEAIDRKYDKLVQAAKDGIERLAIEEARQREQLSLRFRQQEAASTQVASVATARVQEAGNTFGTGTGISVIEAKRAEKQALLEIEKKHAQDVLNNSLLLGTKEGELARAQADARIAAVNAELRAIDLEKGKHKADDFVFKLLFGEDDSNELRSQLADTANQAIGAINQILSAQLAAEQAKIQAHQDNINSLQAQLSAEIQLNKEGSASNIQTTLDQIAAEKAAKREALAEARAIAKQQQQINDLQAVSSISLAVANIIAGWSTVPIAGSILGIVAAAAMVASFVGTKAAASDAARTQGSFFTGGFTGDGGKYEEAGTVHKGEFVANQQLTRDYRNLFKNLHEGTPDKIDWRTPEMAALLPDFALPDQMRAEKAAYVEHQHRISSEPMRAEFNKMHDRLAAIEGSNAQMASQPQVTRLSDKRYLITTPNGSTKVVTLD